MESRIRKALVREKDNLLKKKGVVACGMGCKIVDGVESTYPCLTVSKLHIIMEFNKQISELSLEIRLLHGVDIVSYPGPM